MSDLPTLRLQDAWQQCDSHLHHLLHALGAVRPLLPMVAKLYRLEKLGYLDNVAHQA